MNTRTHSLAVLEYLGEPRGQTQTDKPLRFLMWIGGVVKTKN